MSEEPEIEVGTFEAKNRLSELLEEAARGSRIWIPRRGKRVALLSSGLNDEAPASEELLAAFRGLRSASAPGPESLRDLIEEGRR